MAIVIQVFATQCVLWCLSLGLKGYSQHNLSQVINMIIMHAQF
jgi:hypothetical protein